MPLQLLTASSLKFLLSEYHNNVDVCFTLVSLSCLNSQFIYYHVMIPHRSEKCRNDAVTCIKLVVELFLNSSKTLSTQQAISQFPNASKGHFRISQIKFHDCRYSNPTSGVYFIGIDQLLLNLTV